MCHDHDTFHDTQLKCVMIHDTFVDTFLDTVQKRVPAHRTTRVENVKKHCVKPHFRRRLVKPHLWTPDRLLENSMLSIFFLVLPFKGNPVPY